MLNITRKIGESVMVGTCTRLTVTAMRPHRIMLQLTAPGINIEAPVDQTTGYEFECDGHTVVLRLGTVARGMARIGFQAPRELQITRGEVLAEATHGN